MNSPFSSDAQLISSCLKGDANSWDMLIERYQGLIYTLARRMGLSPSDADDVFQNVSLRLFQNLSDVRDTNRLSSWLTSTTRREVWRYRRHGGATVVLESADHEAELDRVLSIDGEAQLTPDEMVIALEEADLVRRSLDLMPENCRNLLSALYSNEFERSYEEVAQLLSMPVGSIGPRRARCLERLKKIYEKMSL